MVGTVALSPSRALRRPRRRDFRAIFGLFLLLFATGSSIAFWGTTSTTRAVVVSTRDLPAGARLGSADLAVARVRVDDSMYGAAVPEDEMGQLVGRQLAEPLHAQQLLVRAQFSSRRPLGASEVAMTIPVTAHSALGGRVRPGDAVEVVLTVGKGTAEARSTVVLPRVAVYEVGHDERLTTVATSGASGGDAVGRAAGQGPISWVTLVVPQEQVLQLAQAKWAGELDVALLPLQ